MAFSPQSGRPYVVEFNGGAQTLQYQPDYYVPSGSYTIYDMLFTSGSDSYIIASGNLTLRDSVNLSASTGFGQGTADARKVQLTSTAGITRGHRYFAEHADGDQWEDFTCAGVSKDTHLLSQMPFVSHFPTGSMIRGGELEWTFPADEANDKSKLAGGRRYRVQFTHADPDGVTRDKYRTVVVQRDVTTDFEDFSSVRSALRDLSFTTTTQLGPDQLDAAIRSALRYVRSDVLAMGGDPNEWMLGEEGIMLVALRANVVLIDAGVRNYSGDTLDIGSQKHTAYASYRAQLDAVMRARTSKRVMHVDRSTGAADNSPRRLGPIRRG